MVGAHTIHIDCPNVCFVLLKFLFVYLSNCRWVASEDVHVSIY